MPSPIALQLDVSTADGVADTEVAEEVAVDGENATSTPLLAVAPDEEPLFR